MFSSLRTLMRIIIPSRTTIYLVLFIAILNLCTSPIDSKLLSWPVRYYALSTFRHWYEGTPQEARANTETGTDGDARDRQAQPNPPANEEEHRTLSQALYSLLRRLVILYIRDYLFIASTAGILAVLLKAAADLGLFWLALPWARMHACDALLKLPALVNLSDPQALWKANICAWQYKGAGLETVNRLFGRTLAVYWRNNEHFPQVMYAECVDIVTGMIPDAAPSSLYIPRALPTQLTTCPTNIWDAFIPPFLHADEICMRLLGMLDPEATEGVRPLLQPLREVVNSTLGVQVAMALAEGKDAGLPELGA